MGYDLTMQITYQDKTVYFGQAKARVFILLNGKEYRVKWGRDWQHDVGNLPHVESLSDSLLNAGMLQGFKCQRVPILADEYTTTNNEGFSSTAKLKSNQYICGILVKYLQEKRVYVVSVPIETSKGIALVPKIGRFTKAELSQVPGSSDYSPEY